MIEPGNFLNQNELVSRLGNSHLATAKKVEDLKNLEEAGKQKAESQNFFIDDN